MKRYGLLLLLLPILAAIIASSTALSQSTRPSNPRPSGTPAPQPAEAIRPPQQGQQEFSKQEIDAAKKAGVMESELENYLRQKRQGVPEIKRGQQRVVFDQKSTANLKTSAASDCVNGGFEMGNFTNWYGSYGSNSNGTIFLNTLTGGWATDNFNANSSRHSIMPMLGWPGSWQGPFDPIVGNPPGKTPIPLPVFPGGGNHMLRLGNPSSGAQAETANTNFLVTPGNADFRFRYAVVLEDPGSTHATSQKPFFSYWIYDLDHFGSGSPIIDSMQIVANAGDPFFQTNVNGSLVWRRVSCHRVDLTPYIGHRVWVLFSTADCSLGAHFGYAYIDSLCETESTKPIFTMAKEFCPNQPMMADGTQTEGETQYTWSIVETDSAGNNPVSGTLASETFPGQITAPRNMRAWYISKGKTFKCGKYYKVTLRTESECSTGDETSKVILNSCPPAPVITGPASACATGTFSVNAEPGTNYNWIIVNGTPSSTTGSTINVTWNNTNGGTVIVSATNACGSKATSLKVAACKDKCCQGAKPTTKNGGLIPLGNGAYTFNPVVNAGPPNVLKVTATIISTSVAYPSAVCGVSGPASSYMLPPNTLPLFLTPALGVPYSREVVWESSNSLGTSIAGGTVFPFKIQLPPPPTTGCTDIVTFCIKFTITDVNCNVCELVQCYSFKRFALVGEGWNHHRCWTQVFRPWGRGKLRIDVGRV